MKSIKTKAGELITVEVPMDAWDIEAHGNYLFYNSSKAADVRIYVGTTPMSILGTLTNGVPDFDVEPYVHKADTPRYAFWDYVRTKLHPKGWIVESANTPKQSFQTLLTSQGIEWEGKKLIFLK